MRVSKLSIDIIVATGADEGGSLPDKAVGTFSVISLLADAVKNVPVVAAGGISDRRTARAAHVLGAQGMFAGSVFISACSGSQNQDTGITCFHFSSCR
ncbi:nitronate monooxygenase [Salmonella enterica subsp. enterica serovar Saintpaul]|nr:nitronate monooxygenase [Salmonella enterica subsp. enterica serovar Saintpaul]